MRREPPTRVCAPAVSTPGGEASGRERVPIVQLRFAIGVVHRERLLIDALVLRLVVDIEIVGGSKIEELHRVRDPGQRRVANIRLDDRFAGEELGARFEISDFFIVA
jgi:hypothetical protein